MLGYMANLALISALADKHAEVFSEALNHASLIDGARLSRAKLSIFPHRDLQTLDQQLAASSAEDKLVITDSVFSMDGDLAPLPELLALCEQHDAWLIVDDAHGFGVLGNQGRGIVDHFNATKDVDLIVGSFSKSLASTGGFFAGSKSIAVPNE